LSYYFFIFEIDQILVGNALEFTMCFIRFSMHSNKLTKVNLISPLVNGAWLLQIVILKLFFGKFIHVTSDNCNHMLFIILSMCNLHLQKCLYVYIYVYMYIYTYVYVHKCHLHLSKFKFKTSWKRCQHFNHEVTQALLSTKDFKMFIEKLARNSKFDMHFLIKIY